MHELDLLELAAAWRSEGRRVALVIVVATWSSSPRPPGSQLLADDSGQFMGSVSGGCIEGEVVRRTREVIETGEPALLDFGIANEDAWSVGLSCGGRIQVFVEPISRMKSDVLSALLEAKRTKVPVALLHRMSIEGLYAQPILHLAREARDRAPVRRPTARATVLSNRFCGDEVRLEVRVEEGLIREIVCSVRACVLCEVSALIMRQAMIGKDDSSLPRAEQFLSDLAGGSPVTSPAGREALGKFEPLRRFKSRLDCVLLPLRALRQALSDHRPTSASLSAW